MIRAFTKDAEEVEWERPMPYRIARRMGNTKKHPPPTELEEATLAEIAEIAAG